MTKSKVTGIISGLTKHFQSVGFKKAVLGLSGGVDSALTAKIAAVALGHKNVTALIMPYEGVTDPINTFDAKAWAETLKIDYKIIPINPFVHPYDDHVDWAPTVAAGMNIKARARANILYYYANSNNALVLGSGNKSEITLGYFTKYGDAACDILPIGSLLKKEVWEAAHALKLPETIISKTPTAELATGQTDEGEIGAAYDEIDAFLERHFAGKKPRTDLERKLLKRIQANAHKNALPVIINNIYRVRRLSR